MSENQNSTTGRSTEHNRRASDRGEKQGGVAAGGRRKSDRSKALGRSKAANIAIACSFFFSLGLIAWAFTLPFRSGSLSGIERAKDTSRSELRSMEYEARLSNAAYVQYGRDIDYEFLERKRHQEAEQLKAKGLTKRETRKKWEQLIDKQRSQLEAMRKELGDEGFLEGTVEWQTLKDYEKVLLDAPPEE